MKSRRIVGPPGRDKRGRSRCKSQCLMSPPPQVSSCLRCPSRVSCHPCRSHVSVVPHGSHVTPQVTCLSCPSRVSCHSAGHMSHASLTGLMSLPQVHMSHASLTGLMSPSRSQVSGLRSARSPHLTNGGPGAWNGDGNANEDLRPETRDLPDGPETRDPRHDRG